MVNYHNHTILCGHATGEMDEYIKRAVEYGLKEFGFSDHAPVPLHLRDGISMSPEDVPGYVNSIIVKKEKYKNIIDIKLGFEIDFPFFDTLQSSYLTDPGIDFIIGSTHYMGDWGVDNPAEISRYDERDIDDIYKDYYRLIEGLVDARFCDIVGHFDLIKKFGHRSKRSMNPVIRRIAAKMSANGIAAEINTSGLRKPVHEIYPSDEIIDILFRENVPVTLGSDSHSPDDVCSGYPYAIEKLKSAGYRKISGFTQRKRHELQL
ncbi:MAG TPA: histidinol-phosphatase HisJ family protein [Spirochaetota bacterium]|nr:histidinol-phosphatase HisJ family protein [Spirochaetota bacterium]HPS85721.1 histidinol-phosphatase HisJ family protein [Spirochaetota bacterium]